MKLCNNCEIIGEGRCQRCATIIDGCEALKKEEPTNKNNPIRWDFSQQEIEKMMGELHLAIKLAYFVGNSYQGKTLQQIKDDWQRKINYNKKRGLWT